MQEKKFDDSSRLDLVEIARVALHASELVSFLVGLRTYQQPGISGNEFAKLRKTTISLVMSVRPNGTIQLPLDGFSRKFVLEYFPRICPENTSFIKSGKNNGYFIRRPVYVYDNSSLNSS